MSNLIENRCQKLNLNQNITRRKRKNINPFAYCGEIYRFRRFYIYIFKCQKILYTIFKQNSPPIVGTGYLFEIRTVNNFIVIQQRTVVNPIFASGIPNLLIPDFVIVQGINNV